MITRTLRFLSWLTLVVFVPFTLVQGVPSRARAATNPILEMTIKDPSSGKSVTLYGAEGEDGQLILAAKEPEGFQIAIPESDLESVSAKEIKEDTYVLEQKDEEGGTQSSLQVTLAGQSGPEENQITYSGDAVDTATEKKLEYKVVTGGVQTRALPAAAIVVIVVVAVGAALCITVVAIDAAAKDCAKNCTAKCGDNAVSKCKTKILAGVSYSKEKGISVGCGADCESECATQPVALGGPQRCRAS